MAPEYVVRGKLTEKADVYSFGVLLIEVVSRKRINFFSQNSFSILQTVLLFSQNDKKNMFTSAFSILLNSTYHLISVLGLEPIWFRQIM